MTVTTAYINDDNVLRFLYHFVSDYSFMVFTTGRLAYKLKLTWSAEIAMITVLPMKNRLDKNDQILYQKI